ncbi:MAG: hypothetical protein J1F16_06095 [Muribaculaceae bacterium]|nr:hypothetical protein [Muribaculaceae bacterium]
MRTTRYIYLALTAALFWSCASDDTTLGGNPISEISIDEYSVLPSYELSKNDVLTISPVINQSMPGKTLSYEWEVEHEIVSTEPVFSYTCSELGSFDCRLIVSNEDGKAFATFTINVNTPYEEGLVIVSKDPTGKSRLSFMLHNIDGTEDSFYDYDVFSYNNPEIAFAPNVSDIVVSNGNLIISSKGDATVAPSIYYLNEKTMDVENYVEVPEYAGFSPYRLMVCQTAYAGASYPILSENGKVYDFASTEGTVVESNKFPSTYDIETSVFYESGSYNLFFWDNQDNVLVTMFDGYGGFYCLKDYEQKSNKENININSNIFAQGNDQPIIMFIPKYRTRDLIGTTAQIYILSESNGRLRRTAINKGIWKYDMDAGRNFFDIRETFTDIGAVSDSPIEKGAPIIGSATTKSLFFAKGNKIYRWYYPQGNINTASVFATVGNETSIVTSFDINSDQDLLYVASYDPTQGGLNGSCHIMEIKKTSSTEEVYVGKITNFNNISYQPVKILYKNK